MKRDEFLKSLSHDHYHGLKLAQLIKKNAPLFKNLPNDVNGKIKYTIDFYHKELIKHFNEEENIIFPLVKGKNEEVDKLFEEIIEEHKKIKKIIKSLEKKGLYNIADAESELDKLGNLLTDHIRKEERNLFMKIQDLLTKEASGEKN